MCDTIKKTLEEATVARAVFSRACTTAASARIQRSIGPRPILAWALVR